MSEQVVYNIQKPQGTAEHTLDPTPTDSTPMISGMGSAIGEALDFYGRAAKKRASQKDYAPLVRALERYKDTVQGSKMSDAKQEILWNNLVEWAGSQGYTHSDIDGYAKTTNANIPIQSLTNYVQRKQMAADAQNKAIEEKAIKLYPNLPADKAIAMFTNELAEEVKLTDLGKTAQVFEGSQLEALEEANIGDIEQAFSRAIDRERTRIGAAFSTDDLMTVIKDKSNQLAEAGWRPELLGYVEDYMYNLWESTAKEGQGRVKDVSESLQTKENIEKHESNMLEIRNSYLSNAEKNALYRQTFDTPYGTMTGARVVQIADIFPDAVTALLGTVDPVSGKYTASTLFQALLTNKGLPEENQSGFTNKLFMKREFAELAESSPNPVTRVNAANTQVNSHTNWIERESSGIRMSPNSKMTDLMRLFNSNIRLNKEDYTSTPERIEKNKEFTSKWMSMGAAVLGNELNNSLPLFDDKGQLRLYKINRWTAKEGEATPYYSEDITEGYSMFGDRNVFSEEYATSIPMFVQKTAEITNTPVKEVKDLFNAIMVANSDVGKRIASGLDTRGRFISLESPLNGDAPVPPKKAQEILEKILKGGEFNLGEAKKATTKQPTSTIKAPIKGTVEAIQEDGRDGFNKRIILKDSEGNFHTFSSTDLNPLVKKGDTVEKGQVIGTSDKDVKEKTYTETQAKELFKSQKSTFASMIAVPSLDLNSRIPVKNDDGTISTEESITIEEDGVFVNIPTIVKGARVSEEKAIDNYHKTGEHLGKFTELKDAEEYAKFISETQARRYGPGKKSFWDNPKNAQALF